VFFLRPTKKKNLKREELWGEGRESPQKEQMNKRVDATERQATRRADAESNLDRHSSKRRLGQKKGRLGETTPRSKSGKQGEPLVRVLRQFQAKAAGSQFESYLFSLTLLFSLLQEIIAPSLFLGPVLGLLDTVTLGNSMNK